MRFSNFASGCFGKIVTGIFCIILGVVLAFGGLALGGYIIVTKEGMMGTVEDLAQNNGLPIDFYEEYRELSILEWGKKILPILGAMTSTPIGEIEMALGLTISTSISDVTGIPEDAVRESTLSGFGETFSQNVTLEIASDKFGIQFPNIPLFNDAEYLKTPLAMALKDLENFPLEDFVEIDDDSSPIIRSLRDLKIGELSDPDSGLDNRINSLMLHEVITIVEEGPNKSNNVLIHLKDVRVGDLGTKETNDHIMQMTLEEVIDIDPENKVLYELREKTLAEIGSEDAYQDILNMPISNLMNIDENSSRILQYFKENNTTLDGDDGGVNAALKVMTLSDIMDIKDPSEPGGSTKVLWALKDCPLETIPADGENPEVLGINDKLRITPLKDLLVTGEEYIWEYIGESTIEDIGQRIDNMGMCHVMEITITSPPILRKMRAFDPEIDPEGTEDEFGDEDLKVKDLHNKLEDLVRDMKLGEIIAIDSSSESLLQSLKDTPIKDLNDKIATLKIREVFEEEDYSSGFLSMISPDTLIYDVAFELETAVSTVRLQRLINIGVVNDFSMGSNLDEYNAKIRNSVLSDIVEDFVEIIANPAVIPSRMTPKRHYLPLGTHTINMELIDSLSNFEEGDTLVLSGDASMEGAFTKIFNVLTDSYTLTILPGCTIRSATFDGTQYKDNGGYMFFGTGYYPEIPGIGNQVNGGGNVSGFGNLLPPPDIIDNAKIVVEIDPT